MQRAEWESGMAAAQEPGLGHRPGDAAAPRSGDGLGKHPPGSRHGLLPELWASGPGLWGVKLAPGSNLGQ